MANKFWIGGTGTWDASTTTHWATASGGTGGTSVPAPGDTVTFDSSSGGGTVTVNTNPNIASLTFNTFAGTLDFSANNNNITITGNTTAFSCTGSGTRTLNMGNGTWTFTGTGTLWNTNGATNFTFNPNGSTIKFAATTAVPRNITPGAFTFGSITIDANTGGGPFQFNGVPTSIGTLTVNGPNYVYGNTGSTYNITTLSLNGTSTAPVTLKSAGDGSSVTISVASNAPTMNWAALRDLTCTGGATFIAQNSFDLGHNSGVTILPPVNPPQPSLGIGF